MPTTIQLTSPVEIEGRLYRRLRFREPRPVDTIETAAKHSTIERHTGSPLFASYMAGIRCMARLAGVSDDVILALSDDDIEAVGAAVERMIPEPV